MRIFIVARGYPTERYKMNGLFEFDQAKALTDLGHEVVYLAIDLRSCRHKRKWGIEELEKNNVKIVSINLPCGRVPTILLYMAGIIGVKKVYKLAVEKYGKPDIIHSHFLEISYMAIKALQTEKIPIVVTEHSSAVFEDKLNGVGKRSAFYVYQSADGVIAVSSALAKFIKDIYKRECIVIPNMLKFENVSTNVKRTEGFHFVSIGSLIYGKRMDLLIEAFYNAFCNKPDVKLIIIGDGNQKEELSRQIRYLKMTNQIALLGIKSREEISKLLQQSDCFVLASKSETFGLSYIEAMSFGLPIIATKCGGPIDFVSEQNGILIEVDNKEELVISLKYMEKYSKDKYNKLEIQKSVINKYSSMNISKLLVRTYQCIKKGEQYEK